jgi:quercetin dioxygenase-like cupin family protein
VTVRIIRHDQAHFWQPHPGVEALDFVRGDIGAQSLLTGVATIDPGAGLVLHTHDVEESVTVIEGEATCEVDGEFYQLRPYDTSYVPAGVPHRFNNQTDRPVRILYAYPAIHVARDPVAGP